MASLLWCHVDGLSSDVALPTILTWKGKYKSSFLLRPDLFLQCVHVWHHDVRYHGH